MTLAAPGVLYRPLGIQEVLQKIRARHEAEIARHNAAIVEGMELERAQPRRDQVLEQFTAGARRLAR